MQVYSCSFHIIESSLVLELNASCDVQQIGMRKGPHNKGCDRPTAILVIWRFEHNTVVVIPDIRYQRVNKLSSFLVLCVLLLENDFP
jgi:hypothetical protein